MWNVAAVVGLGSPYAVRETGPTLAFLLEAGDCSGILTAHGTRSGTQPAWDDNNIRANPGAPRHRDIGTTITPRMPPKPRPRCRAAPGRSDVGPVTRVAALQVGHSGRGCEAG
jgi:hypothetical protein